MDAGGAERCLTELATRIDRTRFAPVVYCLAPEPQREDVIVFKYPCSDGRNDSRVNYIKRLVGLPGDTIRIQNGDVWVKSAKDKKEFGPAAKFVIARRPPRKLLAMLQPVFDNDYMPRIANEGWPARWTPADEASYIAGASGANETIWVDDLYFGEVK